MAGPDRAGQVAEDFRLRLASYKGTIDADIAAYAKGVRRSTPQQYGEYAALTTDAFLNVLTGDGKRLRGALVMVGYKMLDGQNRAMILRAATAIEMLHAYVLIIDDIQDGSETRRGRPSAHVWLAQQLRAKKLKGDTAQLGVNLAINAAVAGAHAAQTLLANLDATPELRLKILSITNRTLLITAHGQTYDLIQQTHPVVAHEGVEQVLEWKSALYSFINPLQVGMVLAGAECTDTDAITPYALHIGKAFQLADDIQDGDISPTTGRKQARVHIGQALAALHAQAHRWPPASVQFLHNLAVYILRCSE